MHWFRKHCALSLVPGLIACALRVDWRGAFGLLGDCGAFWGHLRARTHRIASLSAHTAPLQAFFVWLLVKGVGMQGNAV